MRHYIVETKDFNRADPFTPVCVQRFTQFGPALDCYNLTCALRHTPTQSVMVSLYDDVDFHVYGLEVI